MLRTALYSLALCLFAGMAHPQSAALTVGTGAFDTDQPVEVSADELSVDQDSGEAAFIGNVLVVQGDVRLSAGQVRVVMAGDSVTNATGIARLLASGGVTFVTPSEAAEAQDAVYAVSDGTVVLTGNVLLTQGGNALAGEKLTIDLETGQARMDGRVRTVFGADGDN